MKILLLDGSAENDPVLKTTRKVIEKTLSDKNHDLTSFTLRDTAIQGCIGCFSCWLKTPGVCILKDAGLETTRSVVESECLILLTRITYGGYSWHLAKAMERLVSILQPYFLKVRGKITVKRCKHEKTILIAFGAVAVNSKEREDVFSELVHWNASNYSDGHYVIKVLVDGYDEKMIQETINHSFDEAGIIK